MVSTASSMLKPKRYILKTVCGMPREFVENINHIVSNPKTVDGIYKIMNGLYVFSVTCKHGPYRCRDHALSHRLERRQHARCRILKSFISKSSLDRDDGDVLSIRDMYDEARMLLPVMDQTNRLARESEQPAVESEQRWQEADTKQTEIRNRVSKAISELEVACQKVLSVPCPTFQASGSDRGPACDMLLHHTNFRMEEFLNTQNHSGKDVNLWRLFNGSVSTNAFDALPGGHLAKQLACCSIDDEPYLIACIAVSMDPFVDNVNAPRSLMLHWSVTDHEGGSWHNNIPLGWHTYPGISKPHGTMAWQTNLAHYNPAYLTGSNEENITQISVHSVVVQIPMAGHFLEERGGGIKFILKRTDNCDQLWIKSQKHHDFYLSLDDAISYLNPPTLRQQFTQQEDESQEEQEEDMEEESSAKFVWARALAENVIRSMSSDVLKEKYEPQYLWVNNITRWVEINDYDMNAGSSPSQYVYEIRLLLDLLWTETSIKGSDYKEQKDLFFLKTECSKIEADVEALDAAEMQSRAIQLEKDRLWEERENAIKEASRVQHEVKNRVETLRRHILKKAGRDTEVIVDDLKALCSRIVLGSEGHEKGAGMFKKWFAGLDSPTKHVYVSETVDKVQGMDAHIVTQVYFEGDEAAVDDAAMKADDEAMKADDEHEEDDEQRVQEHKFPFDTVLLSIAFGEAFPDKLSTSQLSLHYGLVRSQHTTWISAPESTQVAIQRENSSASDIIEFEAFKIKHKNGKNVFVDPIVRALCIRLPVEELRAKKIVGVEFVLKSKDDVWIRKEGGDSNFFVPIPMIKD